MDWLWLILMGLGTGAFGVLVGAGGGFILGPLLLIFFNLEPRVVAGTTLALVAINATSGTLAYARMRLIDLRSAWMFSVVGIPGAVLAPFVVSTVAGSTFRILFGTLLLSLAAYIMRPRPAVRHNSGASELRKHHFGMFIGKRDLVSARGEKFHYEFSETMAVMFNFLLGFVASFFGVGAGFLRTPVLVYVFSFPVRVAVATSIFTLATNALSGSAAHIILGNVSWRTFLWAGLGLLIGGQIGARLTTRVRTVWLMRILALVLTVLGVRLVIEGIF